MSAKFENFSYIDMPCLGLQSWAVQLVDLAKNRGIDPDRLLKGTKLFYQDFTTGKDISIEQFYRLLENCNQLDNQRELSFLLGSKLLNHNPLYSTFAHANSLSDLKKLITRAPLNGFNLFNAEHRYHQGRHYFIINLSFGASSPKVEQLTCEIFASFIAAICKWRIGKNSNLTFSFPYAKPKYIEQYQTNLQADIKFSQQLFMISICSKLYNKKLLDGSPNLFKQSLSLVKYYQLPKKVWLQQVRNYLESLDNPSLEHVSDHFGVSTATFKRKLKKHNTNFSALLDSIYQQKAAFNITTLEKSNENVASELNFSDSANFRRAFKRWTGMTPSQLRYGLINTSLKSKT